MGWFSRAKSPSAPPPQRQGTSPSEGARGRYGPRVRITGFDLAPEELTWQLPIRGELFRVLPGPDRPDYTVMLLEQPLHFYPGEAFDLARVGAERLVEDRQGRRMVEVHALLLAARFVGQQLHPGMVDLPVNVAYVIDHSLSRDAVVDFAKIEYVAVGFLTEERAEPVPDTPAPTEPGPSRPDPGELIESVAREVAAALRQGIADRRGSAVETLTATITVDAARRISGLTGNADGTAPEPTPETFEHINAALARLAALPAERALATLTLHIAEDEVTVESSG